MCITKPIIGQPSFYSFGTILKIFSFNSLECGNGRQNCSICSRFISFVLIALKNETVSSNSLIVGLTRIAMIQYNIYKTNVPLHANEMCVDLALH